MNKNKKDYFIYTISLQIIMCVLLFGAVYGLKKANSDIYKTVKEEYFDNINENIELKDYIPSGTTENATTAVSIVCDSTTVVSFTIMSVD